MLYLERLLAERRSASDLLAACKVYRGLGNNAQALDYARELHTAYPQNEDGSIAYVQALIDTGKKDEAGKLIEERLAQTMPGAVKSRYYYLRSRVKTGEDNIINELRSSLFEDPRNVQALIAMFEIYHRKKDERRAVLYLKQALALSPENSQLKRYAQEYGGQL